MSRIGIEPIQIPAGVEVKAADGSVFVKGPQGELSRDVADGISVKVADGVVTVARDDDTRQQRSLHGLTRSLINNMVLGVLEGFTKDLEIVGVGYRAAESGKNGLELSLGFSHTVLFKAPDGISFDLSSATNIKVKGIDKQLVGQVAADIRDLRKPEPYKGKGIRYAGERVIRKAGKAAK